MDKIKAMLNRPLTIEDVKNVMDSMVLDVYKESAKEIVKTKEAANAIKNKTRKLFYEFIQNEFIKNENHIEFNGD